MIRVVESQLDPGERERWRAALARPPLVARRKVPVELEALLFALPVWCAAYLSTLVIHREASLFDATLLRALAAAAAIVTLRAAFTRWRAAATTWVNGRYLYAWGYAQIEDGVMRVVPLDEVGVEVRGRALGLGPIRVTLRAERWSTTLWLAPNELDGLADALDVRASLGVDDERRGYRDAPAQIAGTRAAWGWSRASRDAVWASGAAMIGIAFPWVGMQLAPVEPPMSTPAVSFVSHPYTNSEDLRGDYAAQLESAGGPDIEGVDMRLGPCSRNRLVVESVESYLTLALSGLHLGPLHPEALFARPRPSRARLWSRCTWEVDRAHGTFARAEARWGLDRDDKRVIDRRAVVDVTDVIRTIEICRSTDRALEVSPRGIAVASVTLLHAVIAADVFESRRDPVGAGGRRDACLLGAASTIAVQNFPRAP